MFGVTGLQRIIDNRCAIDDDIGIEYKCRNPPQRVVLSDLSAVLGGDLFEDTVETDPE